MSREGYVDKRGNAADRARRRAWILETFDPDLGPGRARCAMRLAADCLGEVDAVTLSVDRIEAGGSYRRGNIQPGCKPCQDRQGGLFAVELHRHVIDDYRAQRDAREALRESGALAPTSVAGVSGSSAAFHQLEAEEFNEHVPAVTFREWLIEWGESRRDPLA